MRRNITCGIDIGSSAVRVIVAEYKKGDNTPSIIGIGKSQSLGMRMGYVANVSNMAKSIKTAVLNAEKTSGIKIKKAYISCGGIGVESASSIGSAVISKADKEVTNLDVSKALSEAEEGLNLVNKKVLHVVPQIYKLDGKEIHGRPEGMHGVKIEVKALFVTITKQHLEDLVEALADAGIEPLDISCGIISSSNVVLSEKQKMAGGALLDIGSEFTSLAVFENGFLMSLQILNIGGADITKDIALGLKISLEEAEGVKVATLIGDFPKKKIEEIVEARLGDIFELVENHLKKIKRSGLLPAGITIIGGCSHTHNIEQVGKNYLRLPTRVGPTDQSLISKFKIHDNSWYEAVSLVLVTEEKIGSISIEGSLGDNFKSLRSFFKSTFSQLLP